VKVSDALGNVNKYFIGSTGGEILFRSERVLPPTDGATAIQTAWFNDRGDLIKEVDPLGRATINHYNDAHRLIRTLFANARSPRGVLIGRRLLQRMFVSCGATRFKGILSLKPHSLVRRRYVQASA
jgi:YD repeat-containing protein